MQKSHLLAVCSLAFASLWGNAQVVTTEPASLKEDDTNVTIYFHADQGNKGLANLPAGTPVYAHTGVITEKSTGDSDWKYAPTWGDNSEKYELTYVSDNLYSLYIGDLHKYYGVPANESITKLAFVFRNANGSKEGKGTGGADILVPVSAAGLQVELTTNLEGLVVTPSTATVHFTLTATEEADLSININGNDIATLANAKTLECDYTFTETGTYNVYGNAVKDGVRKSTSFKLSYTEESPIAEYPGGVPRQGAVANADGSVTFCLCAPLKAGVYMVTNRNDYTVSNEYLMNRQDYEGFRYFWITLPDVDTSETPLLYYYLVDSQYSVCDPYANLVLDPSNDRYIKDEVFPNIPEYPAKLRTIPLAWYQPSVIDSFEWTDDDFVAPDHSHLLIYELLVRDFTGTEGKANGNGTIKAALAKLPYLKQLGINAIELLPINEFNGNNSWGYNPNFYFAPDKAYGTPADYKEFINACHENGIAVILDMVFNQSDWLHPWYQLYPVGENPFYNATAPHAYSVLNDWNQGYPPVRKQWQDVVRYWMEEYHIDGYRFDLVKGLGNNDSYANNGDSGTNAFNQSRIDNMRVIQEAMLEINPDAIFINENLAGAEEENKMAEFGQQNWANINGAGCQYAMGYNSNSALSRFYAPSDGNRLWGSTVSYLESHDEQRLGYQQKTYGANGVKGDLLVEMRRLGSAAAQMILAPGAHMIWQFSELGNDENTKDANGGNNTSPKKVLWSYYDVPERRDLYYTYAALAEIRNNNPELFAREGVEYTQSLSGWNTGRSMTFTTADKEMYLAVNPRVSNNVTIKLPFRSTSEADYTVLAATPGAEYTINPAEGTVTVAPNSFVVVGSNNVSGVESVIADEALSPVVATEWYTVDGRRVNAPANGLYIRVDRRADGSATSVKNIVR